MVDEECLDAKPYISKGIFLSLIHRAWVAACQRDVFTQGWARMGLKACPTTGMVIINRHAIGDSAIGASVKYTDDMNPGTLQSVRVKGALDEAGVIQYHDYDFDFSGPALDQLANTHPHVVFGFTYSPNATAWLCYASASGQAMQTCQAGRAGSHNSRQPRASQDEGYAQTRKKYEEENDSSGDNRERFGKQRS